MTAEIGRDPWTAWDGLAGVELVDAVDEQVGPVAFYGRCSTEDNQDPNTSRGWQLSNARKLVEPLGARVVAEFFDVGQSRSVPWERRGQAARLLAQLKNPNRGWAGVVVGEGTRCWFGNQFSLTAPRFAAYGVELWVPELGGKFEDRNPSHKMLMSVLGGMSESERQHVQARVRAAMDAQVLNEGRHQGGRAPYGYVVADGGPHPNPRKAAEGYRLRVLEIDEVAAEVVRRIFAEYLDGKGDRAIAHGLNREGIPCPSARRPDQNHHRLADGWQGSTVRSILENPRYTGYAVFGRWAKHETLLDPDDVAAGHVVRFRRASANRVVRSRQPAHPMILSVEEFTQGENVDRTVAALIASQGESTAASNSQGAMKKRLADAEARLRRYQAAIAAGVDPAALVEAINEAQAQRAAARAELEGAPAPNELTDAEVYAMIDSLGDVGAALADARPESLSRLYQHLGLELRYEPHDRAVVATASPRVVNARVRGGT